MKKYLLPIALATTSFAAISQESTLKDQVLIDQINNYKVKVGRLSQLSSESEQHQFGVKWNSKGSCGDFDMDFNIQNTLDKKDLQRMMDSWLSKAKSSLDPASLIALAFQRANPDLYEKIQNGILQAKVEFADDSAMCESIQEAILDQAPDGAVEKLKVKQEYADKVSTAVENNRKVDIGDMTDFIYDLGDEGVEIMDQQYGGKGQPPIESTKLVARAGANALAGRENQPNSQAGFGLSAEQVDEGYGVVKYFPTVEDAEKYIVSIVGETKYRTAEDTNAIENTKPLGVGYQITVLQKEIALEMEEIIESISNSSSQFETNKAISELNSRISPSMVTRVMFNELMSMDAPVTLGYIDALSKEFASQITIEKTLVARRILYTGMLESSIQSTGFIQEDIERKLELLDWEMDNVEREHKFRSYINRNASTTLLQRAMKNRMSEGLLIQGDKGVFR